MQNLFHTEAGGVSPTAPLLASPPQPKCKRDLKENSSPSELSQLGNSNWNAVYVLLSLEHKS